MRAGAIPVVSDTVGTSVYVADEEYGIVLHGVQKKVRQKDQATGVLVNSCCQKPELEHFLVEQMTDRVCKLLDDHGAYWEMYRRATAYARKEFSGQSFAENFWSSVSDLYSQSRETSAPVEIASDDLKRSLSDCTILNHGWGRIFESSSKPMLRIKTEFGMVWELGGAMIQTYGNPRIELNNWSVLAQYYKQSTPLVTYANTLEELEGTYLHPLGGRRQGVRRKLVRWISKTLLPFPVLYRYAAHALAVYRRYGRFGFQRPRVEPEVELVRQGVSGYNILRHRDRYYAILQREGEFSPARAEAGGYSSCYISSSVEEVLRNITASIPVSTSFIFNKDVNFGPGHDSPDSIEVSKRGIR
ncbi:MAG: hypothetical protein KF722_00205 [Nitrospira sp.]|nr:hypothetical protein [Nitrospira sp.]